MIGQSMQRGSLAVELLQREICAAAVAQRRPSSFDSDDCQFDIRSRKQSSVFKQDGGGLGLEIRGRNCDPRIWHHRDGF